MAKGEEMVKGEEIRFVKGTYAGNQGWLNTSKKSKSGRYDYVIVNLDDKEKPTRVLKSSIRKPFQEPETYEEAAVQQHPEMELAMIRLAEMFAECGVQQAGETVKLFVKELERAHHHQLQLGSKARYRNVNFTSPVEQEQDEVSLN